MDYDDNEFQSQNFQLVGGENTRFPSSSHSFALPKLDLDEHFEVHLRFDTLGETESLLGIQGPDNNWIDGFSSGSNALDFTCSPAESCSISRHNNVWSEATSSESVEMLLKSVGEDDMKTEGANVRQVDAHEQLICFEDTKEPYSKTEDNINTDPALPADRCLACPLGMTDNSIAVQYQLDGMSQTSIQDKSSKNLGISSLSEKSNCGKSGTGQQTVEKNGTTPPHDAPKIGLELDEELYEQDRKEIHKDSVVVEKATEDNQACIGRTYRETTDLDASCPQANTSGACGDIIVRTDKFGYQMVSEETMEKDSDIEEEAPISDDSLKNEYEDCKVNRPFSVGHKVDEDMKSASYSEATMNASLLTEGCLDPLTPGNRDGFLESITHPVEILNKDSKAGVETPKVIEGMSCLPVEDDGNLEKHSIKMKNGKLVNSSCGTEEFNDVCNDIPECSLKGNPTGESRMHVDNSSAENTRPVDKHREVGKIDSAEETQVMQCVEYSRTENNNSHMGNISIGTAELHSSNDHAYKAERTECKDSDCLKTNQSEPTSQELASADSEKCAEAGPFEKEIRVGPPQTIIMEKSSSPALMNAAVVDILSSNDHGPFKIDVADRLGSEVNPDGASLPVHAGSSTSTDGHFSIALDNVKLGSSDIPSTSVAEETLDKNVPLSVSEHKEAESPSLALCEEKDGGTSVSSFPACSNDAEDQVLAKPVSDPIVDGLPVKEVIHDVTVSSISLVGANPASPEKATDQESCSEGTPLVVSTAAPAVHASVQSSYTINKEGNDVNVVLEGGSHSQKCTQFENKTEHYSLEARPENSGCAEPICGSPGGISYIGQTEDTVQLNESNKELLDQTHAAGDGQSLISSDTVQNADAAEPMPHDNKEGPVSKDDRKIAFEDNLQGSHFESEGEKEHGPNVKATDDEQIRLESTSCTEQTTALSGNPVGETPLEEHINREKQFLVSPCNVGTASKDVQSEEMRQCPKKEDSNMRTSCLASVQAAGLPNLSSSISPAVLFHQPFTDLQQVQLRAQIFVYGSLIQGAPPDEACMVSAFGENDGGRNSWEGSWRAAVERFENQKSAHGSWEAPLHSRSGARIPEQVTRCNSLQRKTLSPIVCVSGTKVASSAAFSSVSFPTPLWNVSTSENSHTNMPRGAHLDFNQALTPLHSYPSSQMRQYPGNGAPWFSPSAYPGSLVVSSLSSRPDATPQHSAVPVSATQVTAIRESAVSCASNMQLGTATPLLLSPGSLNVSVAPILPIEAHRKIMTPGGNKNSSTAQKSRKRKKAAVSEDLGLVFPISQPQTELAPVMSCSRSTIFSGVLPLSGNSSKLGSCAPVATTSQIVSPTHNQVTNSGNNEQRVIISEETCSKIEQAKLQAEDAAAIAAAAVQHSQGIWSQLAAQRNSGLASEAEEKLASAAVAAAAAASVAKAAAAAAKVAADAALQAKMLADEALDSVKTGNTTKSLETDIVTDKKLTRLTSVSILKGKDKFDGSSTVISAAREASRRRVEAASAAIKRAENLDAIVKAAELAAEAVSQAGIIVAMGDPLPFKLSELAEAGPENYWKLQLSTSERTARTNTLSVSEEPSTDGCDQGIIDKGSSDRPPKHDEILKVVDEDGKSSHSELLVPSERNFTGAGLGNTSFSYPDVTHERGHSTSNLIDNKIQKGSLVEVVPDEDGLRGVWFSSRVLDLKDGKAYVCYNDLLSDEGSGQLKEWIQLEVDDNRAPRIRIAHPLTAAVSGAKKRRREAIGSYDWAVGDHVDALIRDGWWEGIVTEKSIEDETKLTVHFPAGGDTSIVRAWNLRPSLVWKEGEWTQWSRHRDNTLEPYEGDTPNEKRPKVSRFEGSIVSEVEAAEVGKSFIVEPPGQPVESRPLMLSAKDTVFSVGKNVEEGINSDLCRIRRTGLQKEGSRVVFGVPKPGKKRKFMDVSKHSVAETTEKISEGNDSIKFAKYLMPQASRSLRNTSRVDRRGKAVVSKPKWSRPIKSQITQNRNAMEKENSSMSNTSASSGRESGHGPSSNAIASFNNQENHLERTNTLEAGSFRTLGTKDVSSVELSMQPIPGVPTSRKADLGVKQKHTPIVEKPLGSEDKTFEHTGKVMSEAIEPRRSNRRIQPTSRLLEGLQSSLIISKIPSVSHDRGSRALHRGVSSSKGKAHG